MPTGYSTADGTAAGSYNVPLLVWISGSLLSAVRERIRSGRATAAACLSFVRAISFVKPMRLWL